jgi:hypothetical protein
MHCDVRFPEVRMRGTTVDIYMFLERIASLTAFVCSCGLEGVGQLIGSACAKPEISTEVTRRSTCMRARDEEVAQ